MEHELSTCSFDSSRVTLEVTENVMMDEFDKVNELKIDKSLVVKIIESSNDMKLIEMVCQRTEEYKLRTIAEGVEQEAHRKALTSIGCRYHQGYLYAKPVPLQRDSQ